MLYTILGNDREKMHKMVNVLQSKKPNASFFRIDQFNFTQAFFEELISGQGLFENKYIVTLDHLFEDKDISDEVFDKLSDLKESENIFIVLESKVSAKLLRDLEKYSEKVDKVKESDFAYVKDNGGIFKISDAFGNRDKKKLWILYVEFLNKNISAEEIHGTLFWQLKTMLLVSKTNSAKEAGIKPFVYSKAKKFLKNYSEEELKNLMQKMVSIHHDSRRGIFDLEIALEKFVLNL